MIYHCSQRLPSQVFVYTHTSFTAGKTQKIACLLTEGLIRICCAVRGGASPENVSPVRVPLTGLAPFLSGCLLIHSFRTTNTLELATLSLESVIHSRCVSLPTS